MIYVLTTRSEHERRPPSIAIAWVLGMMALPYLVLPLYVLFGRRKLARKRFKGSGVQPTGTHWAENLIQSFDLAAAEPAAVTMHRDGAQAAAALFATLGAAHQQLDICTYILGNDAFGRETIRRLKASAARGVQVRLLLDGVGALQLPRACFKELEAAGVATAIFSPLLARRTQGPRNLRNHRKLVIADATHLWAGGRNLAAEYFTGLPGEAPWQDLSFDVEGSVAGAAASQFEADWAAAGGKPASREVLTMAAVAVAAPLLSHPGQGDLRTAVTPAAAPAALIPAGCAASRAQFVPSGPDQTEDTVHSLLIDACFQARRRILAVSPYFVPDAGLQTAIRLAARRGVQIDVCIPARSNHRLADFARSRSLRALSMAGVRVHLLAGMTHAKGVVFDDSLALAGSVNLDSRSLLLNYECAVLFYGSREIQWLAGWIEALIPQSRPFNPAPPNFLRDLVEGLLLTLAYQL